MSALLKRQESLESGLQRIALERLRVILGTAAANATLDGKAVHEMRKAAKALRALLRLTRGATDDVARQARNRALRDYAAAFSADRDAHVLADAFAKACEEALPAHSRHQAKAPAWLTEARVSLNGGKVPVAIPKGVKLGAASLQRMVPRVLPLTPGTRHDHASEKDEWQREVAVGLRKTYRAGRKLLKAVAANPDVPDEEWHELRKRVKDLGYQLEVLEGANDIRRLRSDLTAIGSALGDARDLSLLHERLLAVRAGESLTASDQKMRDHLVAHLEARRGTLHREALKTAKTFYRPRSKVFVKKIAKRWRRWRGG